MKNTSTDLHPKSVLDLGLALLEKFNNRKPDVATIVTYCNQLMETNAAYRHLLSDMAYQGISYMFQSDKYQLAFNITSFIMPDGESTGVEVFECSTKGSKITAFAENNGVVCAIWEDEGPFIPNREDQNISNVKYGSITVIEEPTDLVYGPDLLNERLSTYAETVYPHGITVNTINNYLQLLIKMREPWLGYFRKVANSNLTFIWVYDSREFTIIPYISGSHTTISFYISIKHPGAMPDLDALGNLVPKEN